MVMICLRDEFHVANPKGSLVIAIKPKNKYGL
jgi:hypothetical protein